MQYSILIYDSETVTEALSEEEENARLEQHLRLQKSLREQGKIGPIARLMPTTAAVTLRQSKGREVILDGPFAETKEQLVGFYVIACDSLAEAIDAAKQLPLATGSIEVRPISWFTRGEGD